MVKKIKFENNLYAMYKLTHGEMYVRLVGIKIKIKKNAFVLNY